MPDLPPLSTQPSVAILIPTYCREEVLVETLQSMACLEYPKEKYRILVIDQTPIESHLPETEKFLKEGGRTGAFSWFRPPQISFSSLPQARNFGIEQVAKEVEVLIFADDDVEVPTNWIEAHLAGYKTSNCGATAGRVFTPGSSNKPNNARVGTISWFGDFSANYLGDREVDCQDFMGCNFSIRSAVLAKSGIFEELIHSRSAIREDSDMALRVGEAGYSIRFVPKAWCLHKASPTGGTRTEAERIRWYYGWFHDNFLFYAKHAPLWRVPFFILHMTRPILACWLYYGRGSLRAFLSPWQGIRDGIRTAKLSREKGIATVSTPYHFPLF